MSYQVLARKWRPRTFRETVGQEHVLQALINALDHDRLHHAYLFTGTRGVGKTSIARILAKCLNCEAGVSSEPCGRCAACTEIAEGRFIDLIEVDAASRTKVEDTRELLENVQYAPTRGRYKVYLIDEVHMLSTHSFNALLKTLEEPPPHVKFLLATTDPQKLPATILSRCLQFSLKNMTPERIVGHLQRILEQEMVSFEEPALWLLGRSADGSMRDALSLTDQAIAYGSGRIAEVEVRVMLGTIDYGAVYGLMEALAAGDAAQLLDRVAHIAEHATDFGGILEELLSLLHRLAMAQAVPESIDNSRGDREQILTLARQLSAEDVQLFYQIGLHGRRDLPLAPDPRGGLEMALLRMLAFRPAGAPQPPGRMARSEDGNVARPHETVESDPVAPALPSSAPAPSAAVPAQPASRASGGIAAARAALSVVDSFSPAPEPARSGQRVAALHAVPTTKAPVAEPEAPAPAPQPVEPVSESISPPAALVADASSSDASDSPAGAPATDAKQMTAASAPAMAPLTLAILDAVTWAERFAEFGLGGVVGTIAANCCLDRCHEHQLHFVLDARHASLFDQSYCDRLREPLSRVLDVQVSVHIQVGEPHSETPAGRRERLRLARLEAAREAIAADPNVALLTRNFGARVDPGSIEPVEHGE